MLKIKHPLYFVRHGQTDWNAQSRYQGSTDTVLSAEGMKQAAQNAVLLNRLLSTDGVELSQLNIVSSPLQRAQQTAKIIAQHLDRTQQSPQPSPSQPSSSSSSPPPPPPISFRADFRELSIGRWEGLTSQQVKDRYYEERKSRKLDRWSFRATGGESMADRRPEIEQALAELPANTLLVTHCVVLRVIFYLLGDLSREAATAIETPHVSIWCWNGAKLHRQA